MQGNQNASLACTSASKTRGRGHVWGNLKETLLPSSLGHGHPACSGLDSNFGVIGRQKELDFTGLSCSLVQFPQLICMNCCSRARLSGNRKLSEDAAKWRLSVSSLKFHPNPSVSGLLAQRRRRGLSRSHLSAIVSSFAHQLPFDPDQPCKLNVAARH